MLKKFLLLLFVFNIYLFAQPYKYYMPLDVKNAYNKGTRSYDGKPGKNYFVNSADYDINVKLLPSEKNFSGNEVIYYYNNSNDTLNRLVIRLYQDILKSGAVRDWQTDPSLLNEGTKISKLIIDGKDYTNLLEDGIISFYGTNLFVKLKNAIVPKSKTKIEIEWSFPMPNTRLVRMGKYEEGTYFMAYFYPQISVYDDIDGWDINDYTGTQEFYNDINNYNVKISVPKDFIVWGTGLLQNAKEILNEPYYERFVKAHTSDNIIPIIDSLDVQKKGFTKQGDIVEWHYLANGVPDFAFAVSNRYVWDATSYCKDKSTKERVFISSVYRPNNAGFKPVAELSKKSIEYFSEVMPGVKYPYPSMTVFNGGGGMEYPMMVNQGASADDFNGTVHVTSHEILHSYFPFYMGTNERKYAWMDEGFAVMLPYALQKKLAPGYEPEERNILNYNRNAGLEFEVPLMILASNLKSKPYRLHAYVRSAAAYAMLKDLLGDEKFSLALKEYMNRWHGKHPIPYDFFFTFENVLKEDLYWFIKPWFYEQGYPDLAIKSVEYKKGEITAVIEKIGNLPIPIYLQVNLNNGSKINVYHSALVWKDGKNSFTIKVKAESDFSSIALGNKYVPDVDLTNNEFVNKK